MYRLENVSKKCQEVSVFQEVDYSFPNKGLVCLMGASGTGKSTLLNMLSGFDNEYQGDIVFEGQVLKQLSDEEIINYRKDYIGFIFQDYHLLEGYTVLENVLYPSHIQDAKNVKNKALNLLKKVGLIDKQQQKIEKLSGGQKQRVAIARALINKPKVILADEPTGALDRKTAIEIMTLIKGISKECLVVLITHDPKICEYADEVIVVEHEQIIIKEKFEEKKETQKELFKLKPYPKTDIRELAWKNFKVSFLNFFLIAFIIAISASCIVLSTSVNNLINESITQFQEKNISLNNGYIKDYKGDSNQIYEELLKDERVQNVYKQYILNNIVMKNGKTKVEVEGKVPTPRSKEVMSFGVMPRKGKKEIAISGVLAKKFSNQINEVIGKKIMVNVNDKELNLVVSGIYNSSYDDFYLSSDEEQAIYKKIEPREWHSVTFDVKDFDKIIEVHDSLQKKSKSIDMASEQVKVIQKSFSKIKKMFLIIVIIVTLVCLFIVIILLKKLQETRKNMVGLLVAIGFRYKLVANFISWENFFLASLTTLMTAVILLVINIIFYLSRLSMKISMNQLLLLLIATFMSVIISGFILKQKNLRISVIESLK